MFLSPPHLGEAELRFVGEAFESNYIAPLGPMVDAFEREFAAYTGIPHCLALASGTAAMHLALRELGVGPGDEVLASTLTFIGSVSPATFLGASVAFIDADAGSWNMDPALLAVELAECARRGKLPKAVIPTDLYGQCCDLERIKQVCERYGIPVVADAAEAMGARYQETGRADGKAEKLKTEMLKSEGDGAGAEGGAGGKAEMLKAEMLKAGGGGVGVMAFEPVYSITLGELHDLIVAFKEGREKSQLPDLANPLVKYLYSTFVSFYDPRDLARPVELKTDNRGWLFELVKSSHAGQIFVSRTRPGITRGNHYHDTKIEKFCVIQGEGVIRLRGVLQGKREEGREEREEGRGGGKRGERRWKREEGRGKMGLGGKKRTLSHPLYPLLSPLSHSPFPLPPM